MAQINDRTDFASELARNIKIECPEQSRGVNLSFDRLRMLDLTAPRKLGGEIGTESGLRIASHMKNLRLKPRVFLFTPTPTCDCESI